MDSRNASEENDHDLVFRVQNGDKGAYDQLMLRHQDAIAQQMRRFSKDVNEIEELTQTVFVKAFISLEGYKPTSPFVHWLKAIGSKVGYDHWREKGKKNRFVPFTGYEAAQDNEPLSGDENDEFEKLLGIMELLAPDERQVLYLIYIDGFSIAETAKTMGWSPTITKMRAYRARRKLRGLLKKNEW